MPGATEAAPVEADQLGGNSGQARPEALHFNFPAVEPGFVDELAYGESPYANLVTQRVERPMALLHRGDLSVTEVCFARDGQQIVEKLRGADTGWQWAAKLRP
jgi:hypothetical protein